MNTPRENPGTTVPPTARTSGAHTELAKTTRSASRDDLRSTSSSLPVSVKDKAELQAFSNRSPTTAGAFLFLLKSDSFGLQTFANSKWIHSFSVWCPSWPDRFAHDRLRVPAALCRCRLLLQKVSDGLIFVKKICCRNKQMGKKAHEENVAMLKIPKWLSLCRVLYYTPM